MYIFSLSTDQRYVYTVVCRKTPSITIVIDMFSWLKLECLHQLLVVYFSSLLYILCSLCYFQQINCNANFNLLKYDLNLSTIELHALNKILPSLYFLELETNGNEDKNISPKHEDMK